MSCIWNTQRCYYLRLNDNLDSERINYNWNMILRQRRCVTIPRHLWQNSDDLISLTVNQFYCSWFWTFQPRRNTTIIGLRVVSCWSGGRGTGVEDFNCSKLPELHTLCIMHSNLKICQKFFVIISSNSKQF